ncbi:MAG TPA: serine hydrolase, partial [Bacteroidota bacterium]|nr:serine hydrolase [Bacteroidota bacterium]
PEAALDTIYASRLVATPGDTMIYSDLGMITEAKLVEKITGMPLDVFARQEFFEPLGLRQTMFNPPQSLWREVAPTEMDTVWRMGQVQGTVHDERSALLGGVAGHAGLFSTASDLAIFMQMLMNGGTYGGTRYLSDTSIALFTRQQGTTSTRALGWDTKSATGSSAGNRFSASSFGHTGFTGTSIWVDPDRKLCVIFLTNRVYPTRTNSKLFRIRPMLHDAVVRALKGDSGQKSTSR